ncbi:frizzled-3-like isoform X2 [Anopheles albimanus]|uniref:Uncharacterized protein n=1 Tax=Anopheles albimanus TaxID=7167 RepID=A0A182FMP4_ANOAL|nr:frizzled-3-like isoform X2 [Anopheles albimanus]
MARKRNKQDGGGGDVGGRTQVSSLRPIIWSGCSKQALFLFCSSLFPLCSPNTPRPVYPCRSLCEQVRRDCFNDPVSTKLWPDYLDCRLLPQPEKHELCMQAGSADAVPDEPAVTDPVSTVPTRFVPAAATLRPAVSPDGILAMTPSVIATVNGWPPLNFSSILEHHSHRNHQQPAGKTDQPPGFDGDGGTDGSLVLPSEDERHTTELLLERTGGIGWPCPVHYNLKYDRTGDDRCITRCGPAVDALYSRAQKELVEWWTLVLSAGCFIFTLMSLVTFWARANGRLDYPDRPILFMVLCYNLLGLCYLESTILHPDGDHRMSMEVRTSGGGDAAAAGGGGTLDLPFMMIPSPISDSASLSAADAAAAGTVGCTIASSQCLAYYIIKHYLLLSASTWWLIFALCWYLSTAKQWSSEALEHRSGLFHVLAWVIPFTVPIVALFRGNIQRFELTGFCTAIGPAEELPALVLQLSGAVLVLLALCALGRLRTGWNQRAHLSRLFAHVLTFGVCYLVPAIAATVCRMIERVEHELGPCPVASTAARCPRSAGYFSTIPTLLRLALTLLGGGSVAIWLWVRQSTDLSSGSTGSSGLRKSGCSTTTTTGYGYSLPINITVATNDRLIRKVGPEGGNGSMGTVGTPSRFFNAAPLPRTDSQEAITRTYSTARTPFAVQQQQQQQQHIGNANRSGRLIDGGGKMHKYCYVYHPTVEPTHSISDDLLTARPVPYGASRSQQRQSAPPTAGYLPVRTVRRSFHPVGPLSMITRI